ncbi:efflux transporter outer membrane subunit [Paraburkholderia phenazinium]|jgi:NodT family efflux transporter outer membrane factor (OMF) lipoprotein|uniref:Efflux transporter, outer membrane factor (OMF) lipoprotein, NodT family n=1 Tax=Paraburkholderia phenazinium TaxID=60549 RepID=A0A1N6KVS5_9BURK|nr:efflux transporter outer membrane subunit [Paraburkholderia phenazinium]SIO60613.1 efflux transporter, outer membrane factor (OMF) lipoprotein, NodT family [Paraburkholderia phenazinium]
MVKYGLPALLAGVAALSACSLAPDYRVPATPVAAQYKTLGPWTSAQPADQIDRNGWWKMYGDTQLDDLETQLLAHNTDLRAAYAHYQEAQAFVAQVESGLYPTISASAVPLRERQSNTAPLRGNGPADYNSITLGASVKYDLDLWGRVRDSVVAGKDEAQATKADLASVQLSLQVELADSYIQLRGLDQQTALLSETEVAYAKALQLTQTLHNSGIVSGLDVSRAQTQLSSAKSQLSQNLAQRALLEHAIAVLVGASASEFSLPQQTAAIALPAIPTGVPSTLLQRRPDVAAAERRVAEANAQIGVARAAYFPDITLGLQGGVQSAAYAGLVSAPNAFWAIGPQLVQYVFDGGYRRAKLDAAKAATEEAGERYRGVVLSAFQQVEDNLALLSYLGTALGEQRDAATSAQYTVDLALRQYKQGTVGYLDVVQAQTVELDAQRGVLDIQTRQLSANVQLLHALGGGWSSDELALVAATPALVANNGAHSAN